MPGTGVPVAIARLEPEKNVSEPPRAIAAPPMKPDWPLPTSHRQSFQDGRDHPPKERRSWSALSYAEQAGIRCQEPAFWQFLLEYDLADNAPSSAEGAAVLVREYLGVASRSHIKHGTPAFALWAHLDAKYDSWLRPTF